MRINVPSAEDILGTPPISPEAYKACHNFLGLEKSEYLSRIFGDTAEYQEDIFFMGKNAASFFILEALRYIVKDGNEDCEEVLEFCLKTVLSRNDLLDMFQGSTELLDLLDRILESLDSYIWCNSSNETEVEIIEMIGRIQEAVRIPSSRKCF